MIRGTVIKTTGSQHLVKTDDGKLIPCGIKGKFRIKGIRLTNPVAVGDQVAAQWKEGDEIGVIVEISPRKNYIIRKSINLSHEAHILASNLDQAIVMVTLRNPSTFSMFIDRFLMTAEAYKIPAKIIFNKLDIYTDEDFEKLEEWTEIYEEVGYPCRHLSVEKGVGVKELKADLYDKISLLSGNSGVGKSSLINALIPDLELRTGEISDMHLSGKHTTTYPEMLALDESGYIIDTPGIRGFGMVDMAKEELYHFYPEIFKVSTDCKYHNCTHNHEPQCAVRDAVESGVISVMRYNNYLTLLIDVDEKYRKTPW